MRSFKDFCQEAFQLNEKLITFGNIAYPKFGQIVILAGGAGSGKGFIRSTLLGIQGNVLDVDALKALAIGSTKLAARIKDETGLDLKELDLRNPENVKTLHDVLANVYGVTKADQRRIFTAALAAPQERKPNLIFDVTLKDIKKLDDITRNAINLGYNRENIHVVWVLNDLEVSKQQNLNPDRGRVVPDEILLTTHEGAAITMARLMDMGSDLSRYLDGDMYIAFNKPGVDTTVIRNPSAKSRWNPDGGMYVLDANYIQIKKKGKRVMNRSQLSNEILDKISDYTPDTPTWN